MSGDCRPKYDLEWAHERSIINNDDIVVIVVFVVIVITLTTAYYAVNVSDVSLACPTSGANRTHMDVVVVAVVAVEAEDAFFTTSTFVYRARTFDCVTVLVHPCVGVTEDLQIILIPFVLGMVMIGRGNRSGCWKTYLVY